MRKRMEVQPPTMEPAPSPDLGAPATDTNPEILYRTLKATGANDFESSKVLWESGEPSCREFAVIRCKEVFMAAAETGGEDEIRNAFLSCPELANAAFGSIDHMVFKLASLELSGTEVECFPKQFESRNSLSLVNCKRLRSLPEGLQVRTYLDMTGCTALERLPEKLFVGGFLDLEGCTALETFPDEIHISGALALTGCTRFRSFGKALGACFSIYMEGCTKWDGFLPPNNYNHYNPNGTLYTDQGTFRIREWVKKQKARKPEADRQVPTPPITRKYREVAHVGFLDGPRNPKGHSFEGSGLSVSLHPGAWTKIAKLGGGETWILEKADPRFYKVPARIPEKVLDWCVENLFLVPSKEYRVYTYDSEEDAERYMTFHDLGEALKEAGVERLGEQNEDEGTRLEEADGYRFGPKGWEYWKAAFGEDRPDDARPRELAPVFWAEAHGYDGCWWEDELDPAGLSAPRGVIFQSSLPEWRKRKGDWTRNEGWDEE